MDKIKLFDEMLEYELTILEKTEKLTNKRLILRILLDLLADIERYQEYIEKTEKYLSEMEEM